jgi:uncharacterized protein
LAAEEFENAKRNDLRDKEMAELAVLEEYASGVSVLGEGEIKSAITEVIGKMRADGQATNLGSVLKTILGPGGRLEGRPVDKAEVANLAKGML